MAELSDLILARTRAQILDALIAQLQAGEMPTTDWTEGSPERVLLEAEAASQVDLWAVASAIASGGLIDLASGAWLTLLAKQRYNIDRTAATATQGTIRLTCSASAGPYTITAGQLQFKGASGNLYRNTTGGTLNTSSTLNVTVVAEAAGSDEGNDPSSTITTMTTPLAGVTCTNPPATFSSVTTAGSSTGTVTPSFGTASSASWIVLILTSGQNTVATFKLSNDGGVTYGSPHTTGGALTNVDSTGINLAFANGSVNPSFVAGDSFFFTSKGTWYTTQGADEESDASVRQRCKARWPDLSDTPTDDVYTAMAKAANASVTKVRVAVDNVIPARVNITIAGSNGTVSGSVVTAVQAYVDARQAFTDDPVVAAAGTMAITLAGATVRVRAQNLATAQASAQANLLAYFGTVGIGDGSTVKVRYSQLIQAILDDSGDEDDSVSGLTLNGGTVDLTVTDGDVVTWSQTAAAAFTWTTY